MRYELNEVEAEAWYENSHELLRINDDGTEDLMGWDGLEPEDVNFLRDLAWVPEELNILAETIGALGTMLRATGVEQHWIDEVISETRRLHKRDS